MFRGMIDDARRRAPFYWSDWRDAWDYRVVPATVYMYFAKYGPCLMLDPGSYRAHHSVHASIHTSELTHTDIANVSVRLSRVFSAIYACAISNQ